jgi:hypothetical protein
MSEFFAQGRIVAGHPCKLRPIIDIRTKKPKIDEKTGQELQESYFALAVPKDVFMRDCLPFMEQVAAQSFPQGIPQDFSWKYDDGDTATTAKGKPFREMEGRAGCYIINYATRGYVQTVYKMENGKYREMAPDEVKCGDYVAVKTTVKWNGNHVGSNPGIYVNAQDLLFIGYGTEIQTGGRDPEENFAGFQPMQFQGMTQQPMMNTAAPMPAGMAQPMSAQPQTQYAQPQPMQGQQLPPPAHDFVQNVTGNVPAPVQNVGQPNQAYASNAQVGGVQNATTYPFNDVPGIPQGR